MRRYKKYNLLLSSCTCSSVSAGWQVWFLLSPSENVTSDMQWNMFYVFILKSSCSKMSGKLANVNVCWVYYVSAVYIYYVAYICQ